MNDLTVACRTKDNERGNGYLTLSYPQLLVKQAKHPPKVCIPGKNRVKFWETVDSV